MAQRVKVLAEGLMTRVILRTHMMEGKTDFCNWLSDLHTHAPACVDAPQPSHEHRINR